VTIQPVSVQRRSGLSVVRLRGRIDHTHSQVLAETLAAELARRRLKLLTVHLDADVVLHAEAYTMLTTAERVARANGKGFGIVHGVRIAGSVTDLPGLKPAE
jgi:hypothetical protein